MRCPNCGAENSSEAHYCTNCSVALQGPSEVARSVIYCSNCGHENLSNARFCASCGAEIQQLPGRRRTVGIPQAQVSQDYMGFWIRLAAQILDGIIVGVAFTIVGVLGTFVPILSILILPLTIYVIYKHLKCQTLGRRLVGIEVVDELGERISFWRGALREIIGKFVSGIVILLGYIWVAFDHRKQGWHDKIAGTYVVRRM